MKKICAKCKKDKELSEFTKNCRLALGVDRLCKLCRTDYERGYYKRNQNHIRTRTMKCSKSQRQRNIQYTVDYLLTHPCVDCGEKDPLVLEFDHRDRSEKKDSVSHLALRGFAIQTVQEEIDKCDVRCANCHRKRTIRQLGWHKGIRFTLKSE